MLFRRKSRKDRLMDTARLVGERVLPTRRTVARTVARMVGLATLLTAASSGVSALRQKSS
jgi:hypothetical protein